MKETTNDEIGIGAYDANQNEFVQVTLINQPVRTIYLSRSEALVLSERIKRKAEALPEPKPRKQ